ncbi:MAG: ankyrin repeat domain-containing protein [Pseudomonadota bacterium]
MEVIVTALDPESVRAYLANKGGFYFLGDSIDYLELLIDAAVRNDIVVMEKALNHGVSVNYQEPRTGMSALHHAAMHGNEESVLWLLEQKDIIPYLQNHSGLMAVDLAKQYGRSGVLYTALRDATFRYSFSEIANQGNCDLGEPSQDIADEYPANDT